ncbi:hypothetical protein [uncultured Deinococcus sp.]|uniref:hypothetical protein n=1 Tax=uncultured Deinococcus sp. TaxID=158789 RepID=UPI00258ED8A6|nr:hypothetical protein [uncultured Deinococcus sp.]
MTAPDPKTPDGTNPAGTSSNAPAFTDQLTAQEIARLKGLLADSTAENTRLKTQVQELEGQVDAATQKALEDRAAAAEAERDRLKGEIDKRAADDQRTAQTTALTGKVRDPEAALALAERFPDLKDKDGNPSVEAIIGKYPYLAPEGTTTPTAPSGAGGTQAPATTTLDKAVESGSAADINAAFDQALKGGN